MNTMKLWKGTSNIAWLIGALLSSFLFFLFCCSPPFYLTHSSLPILFLLIFSPFLPFLLAVPVSSPSRFPPITSPLLPHAFSSTNLLLLFSLPSCFPSCWSFVFSIFFPSQPLLTTTLRPLHLFPFPQLLLIFLFIQALLLPPCFHSPLIPLFSLLNLSFSSAFSSCPSRSSCSLYYSKLLPSSRTSHPLLD